MTANRSCGVEQHGLGAVVGEKRLDGAAVLARFDGNVPLLQELVTIFLGDCPGTMAEIRDRIARADALGVQYAAHQLRGSVGNFGISAAYERARQLEIVAQTGELQRATEVYTLLEEAIRQFQEDLNALVMAAQQARTD